jgi:O-antigen/teichoic acid export membrane protein
MSQVMIPLHRERPPGQSAENFASIRKIRFTLTFLVLGMQFVLAFSGIWLVELLYDDNFVAAGGIVVIIACMNFPYLIGMTYEYAALSRGDSRAFFALLLFKAVTQTGLFILGMELHGLIGALCGLWLAQVLAHPVVIWLAHRHKAWDPLHDVIFAVFGFATAAFILSYHWVDLESLLSTAFLQ